MDKPTASPQAIPTLTFGDGAQAGAGIITDEGPAIYPLTPMAYHVINQWWEIAGDGGKLIGVQAGAMSRDVSADHLANQGMVAVIVTLFCQQGTNLDSDWIEAGSYRTPIKAGAVRVIDAVEERLVLRATNGTIFYFDVPARQFVPSLTVSVPSATPWPTRSE